MERIEKECEVQLKPNKVFCFKNIMMFELGDFSHVTEAILMIIDRL